MHLVIKNLFQVDQIYVLIAKHIVCMYLCMSMIFRLDNTAQFKIGINSGPAFETNKKNE